MSKHLTVHASQGGGTFSRLYHCCILHAYREIDTSKFDTITFKDQTFYDHIFENIQGENIYLGDSYEPPCYPIDLFHNNFVDIPEMQRNVIDKLQFKKSLMDTLTDLERECLTGKNILGVHIRLTDMGHMHPEYGHVTYDNFKEAIDTSLAKDPSIDQIFVATDNNISLDKLKQAYGSLISYVPDLHREQEESIPMHKLERVVYTMHHTPKAKDFYLEAFYDMWLLSKTHKLIQRTSALSDCSIAFSTTIKEVLFLGEFNG